MEVRTAKANQLRIGIREQASLQQRIIGEIDAGHNVAGVKRDLLRFGEEVVGIAVQGQFADAL